MSQIYVRARDISAAEFGVNSLALNATSNSNPVDVNSRNQITLEFDYTYSAATAVTFYIETRKDANANWKRIQTKVVTAATSSLTDEHFTKPVTASTGWTLNLPANYGQFRMASITGTSGAAGDLLTVNVRVGTV